MAKEIRINDNEYAQILQQAVSEIQTARTTVARQVNTTVNSVYWNIGKLLFDRNLESGYGSGVVKRLSVDLKEQFPDMGLSPRNLWNMKRLYERYYQKIQNCYKLWQFYLGDIIYYCWISRCQLMKPYSTQKSACKKVGREICCSMQ